ncbi:MAG: PorV/PorQ family protein [Bacteroidota bacterium]|jgi:hypothetical protein
MKTSSKFLIASFFALVACSLTASAQEKQAQVGFRFLSNPVSAEFVGRGTAGITTTHSSDAIFWNPAMLGWSQSTVDVSLHNTQGIVDINYNAVSASVKLGDFGVLGFSFLAMDYGSFYSTYAIKEVDGGYVETGTFSPYAQSIGIAFSQKMNDRFSYGVQVKYAYQDLGDAWVWVQHAGDSIGGLGKRKYDKGIFAFDAGTMYDFDWHGLRFGATLQNISGEVKYEYESFPLPFSVNFGVSIRPLTFISGDEEVKNLIVNIESHHPRDYGENMKYGLEYNFLDLLALRAGYMTNLDERGFTAGIGVRQEISGFPIRVDYAYEPFGILNDVHFISLGVSY